MEAKLIAVLMAEHPRLGVDSVLPYDVAVLVAKQYRQQVNYLLNIRVRRGKD